MPAVTLDFGGVHIFKPKPEWRTDPKVTPTEALRAAARMWPRHAALGRYHHLDRQPSRVRAYDLLLCLDRPGKRFSGEVGQRLHSTLPPPTNRWAEGVSI